MYSNSLIEIYVIYHSGIPDMDPRVQEYTYRWGSHSLRCSKSLIEIYVIYHNCIPDMDPQVREYIYRGGSLRCTLTD